MTQSDYIMKRRRTFEAADAAVLDFADKVVRGERFEMLLQVLGFLEDNMRISASRKGHLSLFTFTLRN